MVNLPKPYNAHLAVFGKTAFIKGRAEYERLYRRSLDDPEGFWAEQAAKYLTWQKKWDRVLDADPLEARFSWFCGGVLNASENCLDRHLPGLKDKVAYFWEADDPAESQAVTFGELYTRVNRLAAVLKARGVAKGDRVLIYMPMIVDLPVSLLACARIGAVHVVAFGGLGSAALAVRIQDCGAKAVITADGGFRGGREVELKKILDQALDRCPDVRTVIVFERSGSRPPMTPGRDVWWRDASTAQDLPEIVPPEPMDAEDPLFILHTSGSTGPPKGMVHTHGGYLLCAAMTTRLVFDLKDDEVFWCTANIDWITGHTYGVYGPLANGLTSVLHEGAATYPDLDRCWEIVAKHRVSKFYTTPSLISTLAREDGSRIIKHDLSCLRLLGSVGEPLNPELWRWFHHHVGADRAPIVDTWWQTETGASMIAPLPGVCALKPGSCALPFFGVEPVILDAETGQEIRFPGQEGLLFIRSPWPGMIRAIYNDPCGLQEQYYGQAPGMYFTGDGAKVDEDGYFWITGRIDDVITVSSHRLNTAEIESALILHPDVAEAAVVGIPHPVNGQAIHAFVTLNREAIPSEKIKEELDRLMRSEIGSFVALEKVWWTESLPKTLSGKILRRVLKKIAMGRVQEIGDVSTLENPDSMQVLIQEAVE